MKLQFNLKDNGDFYYWIFPLVTVSILVLFNYSGIEFLQELISPKINREFGLVENLQLLTILIIIGITIKGIKRNKHWLENLGFGLLTAFFLFSLLEEMDYGLHYYEYFFEDGIENKKIVRNFHNQGENNFYVRQVIIFTMIIVFVILPLVKVKIKQAYIRHFCADKKIIYSFLVYLFISQMARRLPELGMEVNESLRGNHQEFEELVSYYIILLYMYEIVFSKKPLLPIKK